MSVREEDKQKSCPSRGLGLAAAAIGVGVGAALYYFFSKRPENPDGEGSTSQNWSYEEPQTFDISDATESSDYSTISEHSTTDTSIHSEDLNLVDNRHDSDLNLNDSSQYLNALYMNDPDEIEDRVDVSYDYSDYTNRSDESMQEDINTSHSSQRSSNSTYIHVSDTNDSEESMQEDISDFYSEDNSYELSDQENDIHIERVLGTLYEVSDSDMDNEWDITSSSAGVPQSPNLGVFGHVMHLISPHFKPRERSWSLEECSICFEVMLKDQELMTLPCTHNFHVQCIGTWLQEQQTCPMCRKAAE